MNKKTLVIGAVGLALAATLSACSPASTASHNLSQAADHFEIDRRIVFLNVRTGDYEFVVEGKCSITDAEGQLEVTCRVGENEYLKHFLGKGPDFTYFAEQMKTTDVSVYHHRIIFKPETVLPEVELHTGMQ